MASTRKKTTEKGSIRWQAVWREPGPGGTERQRVRNFDTRKEAIAHANRMQQDVERRGVGDREKHTVERYLQRWLATLTDRNEHSPTTLSSYRRYIEIASRYIGGIALEKVSPADLDGLYATLLKRGGIARKAGARHGRPLNPRTVLHVHRVLHTAFERARKWKLIGENPARDASAPSVRKSSVRAFYQDEVDRLLVAAATNRETHTIVATLLITGIRRSELLGLAWDAIDLDQGSLTIKRVVLSVDHAPVLRDITKTESSARTLNIPPLLVELLRAQKAHVLEGALTWGKGYRRDPMFCFPRPDGEPHDPMGMTTRLRQVMRRAGIEGRSPTHAWRHTAATMLVGAGSDIKTIQARLGHSTPVITMSLYVHPTTERDQTAGEHLASLIKR